MTVWGRVWLVNDCMGEGMVGYCMGEGMVG